MHKYFLGMNKQTGDVCERINIITHSLLQNHISSCQYFAFTIITDKDSLSSARKCCAELDCVHWCRGGTLFMPAFNDS